MTHRRTTVRSAIAAALVAADTDAESRVYSTRYIPLEETALPAISCYFDDETVSEDSSQTAPRELTRTTDFAVEAWINIAGLANLDDALDAFCEQIEIAMHEDDSFGLDDVETSLSGTTFVYSHVGNKALAMARLVYRLTYHTWAPYAEDAPLDPFDAADIRYDIPGAGDVLVEDAAHDTLTDINEGEED